MAINLESKKYYYDKFINSWRLSSSFVMHKISRFIVEDFHYHGKACKKWKENSIEFFTDKTDG